MVLDVTGSNPVSRPRFFVGKRLLRICPDAEGERAGCIIDPELKQYLDEMKQDLGTRLEAMENRLEATETRLLTEFWKWGRTADMRTREALLTVTSLSERLLHVEDRVTFLERKH